jgi:hypothetical protein
LLSGSFHRLCLAEHSSFLHLVLDSILTIISHKLYIFFAIFPYI